MKKQKICFLIDDDRDDQEIFSMALKQVSFSTTVIVASDCSEALQKLNKETSFIPDYIFLDVNMPRENGKQCLEEIKKRAHLKHIPVIMYTTSLSKKDIEETKKIGALSYIIKPNSISALARELNSFFTNHSSTNITA